MTSTTEVIHIFCCKCKCWSECELVSGVDIYPHRKDLKSLPFWKCKECGNYVGCHHKTKNRTAPLGNIPTPEIRNARKHIHAILDPLWKSGRFKRKEVYKKISLFMGYEFHTAKTESVEECRKAYRFIKTI